MKKELSVFLCAAALFFGSCSDFSVSEDEKLNLPADFDWRMYVEINKDVAMSQIILDVRKNKGSDSTENCKNLLSDGDLARKVYLEYAYCPEKGWFGDDKCTGLYANNNNYSKPTVSANGDTTWRCEIVGCWRGGWNEISDKDAECTGDEEGDWGKLWCDNKPQTLESFFQDSLAKFTGAARSFEPIRMMCQFMPQAESPEEVKEYLENFKLDPTLVGQQYYFIGRNDGRPYKYCEPGRTGEEKSLSLADRRAGYYDYGKYTFCLDRDNEKIYVIK